MPPPTGSLTPTPEEAALVHAFARVERRGRGWDQWPSAVVLEPVLESLEFETEPAATVDDLKRPGWMEVRGWFGEHPDRRPLPAPKQRREPEHAHPRGPLSQLRVTFDGHEGRGEPDVQRLLVSWPSGDVPLAYELLADASRITAQFVVPTSRAAAFQAHVRAHLPGVAVTDAGAALEQLLAASADSSLTVELGLSEEFLLPIRGTERLGFEPLTSLCAAFETIEVGESAVLQLLLEPLREPWAEWGRELVLAKDAPFALEDTRLERQANAKLEQPLYAVVCRIQTRAATTERAAELARHLVWALGVLSEHGSNRLVPLRSDDRDERSRESDLLLRQSHRSGMILSLGELTALLRLPAASVPSERLLRAAQRTRRAPESVHGHALMLGTNEHAGRSSAVTLSEDQRSRHVYVIGASGTGKSTLLKQMIRQDLEQGNGLALLDPHGDLVDDVLSIIPPERVNDVVLLDPADEEYPIGFNVLSAHSELERTLLSSDLVSVFRRLSTSWGDQMTSVLANAILAILESEQGGTLIDLRRFLVEKHFRAAFLRGVRDREIVYFWEREFPLLAGKPQAPLLTRLDTFLRPKPIRYMVAQRDSRLDLRSLMDEGKILLARLSQGAIGEENATLLGTLLVSKLQQLAMSRQEQSASERRPFYLYIDEFQNFVSPSMEAILSGARKYRLGLVLAHQDLRQIQSRSSEVLSSVLSNPGTRICFRVGDQDARTLAEGFAHFDARVLQSLGVGQAIARVERAEHDFNLSTANLPPVDLSESQGIRDAVVLRTREQFARHRAEVEALLEPPPLAVPEQVPVQQSTPASAPRRPVQRPETQAVEPSAPAVLPPVVAAKPASSGGRGGAQHRYLQEIICRWADANGWRSTREEEVLGGLGRVDVALRKGERSIACEIGVSTSAEHELQNIQKCLAAGFERVVFITPEKKALRQLKSDVFTTLERAQAEQTSFCSPEEMFELLEALEGATTTSEATVRGYKVKVRAKAGRAIERASVVSGVIAKAMRRVSRA